MKSDNILDQIRVASPCHARWEDMSGDDRARFCLHCEKHVFNLSAMTQSEVEALVLEKEGRFCGRFHRRRDGRMLTADCRVGRKARRWRFAKIFTALFALATLTATGLTANPDQQSRPRGALSLRVDGWVRDLKIKLGIIKPRPQMTMGVVCFTPPVKPSPTPPVNPRSTPLASDEAK